MNYRITLYILFLILLPITLIFGQENAIGNIRVKHIQVIEPIILRDTLSILPESIHITDKSGDTLNVQQYSLQNNTITLQHSVFKSYQGDSLDIKYQILAIDLGAPFFLLDSVALAATDDVIKTGFELQLQDGKKNIFGKERLDYDGSFSRGFSIGNKQSLTMNSKFNLQMAGIIGDEIEIAAALTDANIPIQAEGNTHQLNEFDRVLIKLKKDQHQLMAGDLDIVDPGSYFSKYHKKLKGLRYQDEFVINNKYKLKTDAGYSISKGKFARNELKTQEGNQGPYKLIGSGGERFLIVLSGTEKVFLNGELLKRGSDFDYVIDYNLAEISFTFSRLISKDSRIIIEFEYVDQNYLRSLQTASANWTAKDHQIYFSLYNEQDSKNTLGNIELDTSDIHFLEQIGDNAKETSRSGIRKIDPNETILDAVAYQLVYNAELGDSVLQFTESMDGPRYIAYFTDVGESSGSYQINSTATVNGRVYEYVGEGLGRYEPIIKLVTPEQKQLFSLGSSWDISKGVKLGSEIALSNYDQNRFSKLGNEDNLGMAAMLNFTSAHPLLSSQDSTFTKEIQTHLSYEYSAKEFKALNPYRSTEFNRDWNISPLMIKGDEHYISSGAELKLKHMSLKYFYAALFVQGAFNGQKHSPGIQYSNKGFDLKAAGDFLWSEGTQEKSTFFRPTFEIKQKISFLNETQFGFSYAQEKNSFYKITDPLLLASNSFYHDNFRFFVNTKASKNAQLQFFVNYRKDQLPELNTFINRYRATDAGLTGKWNYQEYSNLTYSLSYRNLKIDSLVPDPNIKPASTVLSKINHSMKILNNFIISKLQFDLNSGQEAKTEFIFVELTNPGEGNYIWIDENNDGIRQKGEFEAAPFSDLANYIKIIQYNNEFIRVNNGILNHTLGLDASRILDKNSKNIFTRMLARLSFNSILRMNQKIQDLENQGFNIPLFSTVSDSMIVAYTSFGSFNLFYNKANPVFDIQLTSRFNRVQNLQLDGIIRNGFNIQSMRTRYSFKKHFDFIINGSIGNKNYSAELYPTKAYDFSFYKLENEWKFRFSRKTGLQFNYAFTKKTNRQGQNEQLTGTSVGMKLNMRSFYDFNISSGLVYSKYNYSGVENTSIELAMLEGLKNGNNFLWTINLTRKLSNNVDVILKYEGRKTGVFKTIHIGSMQARARF